MVIGFSLGTLLRDDEDDELTASLNDCGTTTLDKDMLGLEWAAAAESIEGRFGGLLFYLPSKWFLLGKKREIN